MQEGYPLPGDLLGGEFNKYCYSKTTLLSHHTMYWNRNENLFLSALASSSFVDLPYFIHWI